MKKIPVLTALLFFIFLSDLGAFSFTIPLEKSGRHVIDVDLDPYYSSMGYIYSLTKEPVPIVNINSEAEAYWVMFRNIYKLRFVVIEASLNPLPLAGVYIKKEHEQFYNDADTVKNINMVKAVTDGFPDPGALSFFFGNVTRFSKGRAEDISGKGYSGFLLSFGNYHIVNNTLVKDYWQEVELKLKGSDQREPFTLDWSYAIGGRFHSNPEINDSFYFAVRRLRIDYLRSSSFSLYDFFIRNSSHQVRIDFSEIEDRTPAISRVFLMTGKKFVFSETGKVVFGLNVGTLRTYLRGYSGSLTQEVDNSWVLLVRPSVHFNF